MRVVVEVGDWEHECCGPAYERDSVVTVDCLVIPGSGAGAVRYLDSHHDLTTRHRTATLRGRVDDVEIRHPDGSTEAILRLPSGRALRGFDEGDDGRLQQPWTGGAVTHDSNQYLVTLET